MLEKGRADMLEQENQIQTSIIEELKD